RTARRVGIRRRSGPGEAGGQEQQRGEYLQQRRHGPTSEREDAIVADHPMAQRLRHRRRSRPARPHGGNRMSSRLEVTEKIVAAKVARGLKWSDVAARVGQSKEWVTAACLGQMTLDADQAGVVAEIFGLTAEEKKWLMVVPY